MRLEAGDGVDTPQGGKGKVLTPVSDSKGKIPDAVKALGPLAVGLLALWPGSAEAAMGHGRIVTDALQNGGLIGAGVSVLGLLLGAPILMAWGKGGQPPPNHPAFEFRKQYDDQQRHQKDTAEGQRIRQIHGWPDFNSFQRWDIMKG